MPLGSLPSPIHPDRITEFVNLANPSKRMRFDLSKVPTTALLELLVPALSGEQNMLVGEYDPAIGAFIIQ